MDLKDPKIVASLIDHTILRPEATVDDVLRYCREAVQYGFASVCVNSSFVPIVRGALTGTGVATCSVVGFPLGAMEQTIKFAEARRALYDGAEELDMVIGLGWFKSGDVEHVKDEILVMSRLAHRDGSKLKVIIETALLTDDEKRIACEIARDAGADFVKTSTGFSKGGALPSDVALMRAVVGTHMGVKASGGVGDLATLRAMVGAGATRIGTSSGVSIMKELSAEVGM